MIINPFIAKNIDITISRKSIKKPLREGQGEMGHISQGGINLI
jgi:hypothetical protein